jgi:hypothetical protein
MHHAHVMHAGDGKANAAVVIRVNIVQAGTCCAIFRLWLATGVLACPTVTST